jgi:electron transport complex protein RnfG
LKKDFVLPILVLSLICLLMSGALAAANMITRPLIEQAAAGRAEAAMKEIIPQAEEFIPLDIEEGLPKTVREIYEAGGGKGFIIIVSAQGYGGEMLLMCGITPDGKIIKSTVLSHSETPGFGDKVFAAANEREARGEPFDAVAGATISSRAYRNGLRDAVEAFEAIKGVRP